MATRWFRWLRALLGLAVIGYAVRFLLRNWDQVRAAPIEWEIHPLWIVASVALIVATYAVLVESWRRMVAGWGTVLPFWPAARIWVLSSMGKYLPGKVWAIAGMAVMGKEAGIPMGVATASAIVLQVVSIGTGALVVALTGSAELEAASHGARIALFGLIGVAVVSLTLLLWPTALEALLRRFTDRGSVRRPKPAPVIAGVLANGAAWLLYGVALYWLAAGLFPTARLTLPQAIGAFTTSYLAGFLLLLAPGGLGVREMVFVMVTQSAIGPAHALALAAASRLVMTAADLLAAAPFLLSRKDPGDRA